MHGFSLSIPQLSALGSAWSPALLFAGGSPGFWAGGFDPARGRLFQSQTGTAASAAGQTVGLALDISQGATLGANLAPASLTAAGWVFANVSGNAARTASTLHFENLIDRNNLVINSGVSWPLGAAIEVRATLSGSGLGRTVGLTGAGGTDVLHSFTLTGSPVEYVARFGNRTAGTGFGFGFYGYDATPVDFTVHAVSVRQIAGRHAIQATALSRPTLTLAGGRYHLYDDGNDTLDVALPAGTYSRAWVDNLGAITVERGIAIAATENVLRATRLCDVLYVQGSLPAGDEASLRAYWQGRFP
ncbi:hypothetical protein [Bosea sp. (in: a-proteobacteria)]|uniref:hypothetical protein n=1 Tax=Bosea sp. (in: a-proteobacteria) TaxID=1871050 RepID=UPI00262790BA|nr:hypothetical protein [Bosea sp. (in: a-proteobacteria)]MCO5092614.1 hypothetical protein [Bosea sp. (in: a-proteobacteria)]